VCKGDGIEPNVFLSISKIKFIGNIMWQDLKPFMCVSLIKLLTIFYVKNSILFEIDSLVFEQMKLVNAKISMSNK
jgi:hypothetical protein